MNDLISTRFLVVDDMAVFRSSMTKSLQSIGVKNITQAEDGAEAKAILEASLARQLPIQFILSDWSMPKCTGISLLRFCREHYHYHKIPFIMVTAEDEDYQIEEAQDLKVNAYILKPFKGAELAAEVKKLLT